MKVKICGLTTLEDALAAAEGGADMLGFNFYRRSPRYISPATCARIMQGVRARGVSTIAVGVFVNAPAEAVAGVLEKCGLQMAQLHGNEPPSDLRLLGNRAFKAIRPQTLREARCASSRYAGLGAKAPALLLDAHRDGRYGGTGQPGNWELAAELAREVPLLLAGGLTPENLAEALSKVLPWGVDVASGIESAPGCKDHRRMISFISRARRFENQVREC